MSAVKIYLVLKSY